MDISTTDGATLRVYVDGPRDAQTIVLCHGWTCSAESWRPQLNALTGQFRVVVYDQRGHGDSTFGSRAPSADVLADDLAAVLDATVPPGERAVLAGHSMGGITIMAWSGKHPEQSDRVGAILLLNTGFADLVKKTTMIPFIPAGIIPLWLGKRVLGASIPLPSMVLFRPLLKAIVAQGASRTSLDFLAHVIKACPNRTRARWGRMLAEVALVDPAPIAGVPTTVFAGALDRLMPVPHSHRIAAAYEEAGTLERLEIFPGVGHMCGMEVPDAVNAELTRLATLVRVKSRGAA